MGADGRPRWSDEVASAVLLGLATLASAWCSYQAALWNGIQTDHLAVASTRQFESMRRTTAASRQELVDASLFMKILESKMRGEEQEVAFLRRHARPELEAAISAWAADRDGVRSKGELPFELPEYRVPDAEEATRLQAEAARAHADARKANDRSDVFVLHTVLAALALFTAGMAPQIRAPGVRRGLLIFGAAVLAVTLVSMARLPRAGRPEVASID